MAKMVGSFAIAVIAVSSGDIIAGKIASIERLEIKIVSPSEIEV